MATSSDHPLQILSYNKKLKKFELNANELSSILNSPDVRDANIAVVSIAGAFRKGKSFMLSFFLRYLNEKYINNNDGDWLGNEDTRLDGFAWRGGFERHTTGLWVWSKIFTKTLPSGEKIGVMLMDTQGAFDGQSTMNDNVTIFSLSTMLSSIQIYNLFNNIQEYDLQHLQLFTEYGKLALQQTEEKAFQMLLFLIRDWQYAYEKPYGFEGGRDELEITLQVTEDQDDELVYVRNHIKSCFDKLDCFLMPSPGHIATTSQNFSGKLKDIDPEFKAMLNEFVPVLLAPENVLPKKISGVKVMGKTLMTFIESYWNIFKIGGYPSAKTILGATAEANNLAAKQEAIEFYQREMDRATGIDREILKYDIMMNLHNNVEKQTLDLFRAKAVMGDEKFKTDHYNKLNESLKNYLILYLGKNEGKNAKNLNETIANLSTQIDNYRSINNEQAALTQALRSQLEQYRRSSDAEKQRLLREIEDLNNMPPPPHNGVSSRYCIIL